GRGAGRRVGGGGLQVRDRRVALQAAGEQLAEAQVGERAVGVVAAGEDALVEEAGLAVLAGEGEQARGVEVAAAGAVELGRARRLAEALGERGGLGEAASLLEDRE